MGEGGALLICGQASLVEGLATEQGAEGGKRMSHEVIGVKNRQSP